MFSSPPSACLRYRHRPSPLRTEFAFAIHRSLRFIRLRLSHLNLALLISRHRSTLVSPFVARFFSPLSRPRSSPFQTVPTTLSAITLQKLTFVPFTRNSPLSPGIHLRLRTHTDLPPYSSPLVPTRIDQVTPLDIFF